VKYASLLLAGVLVLSGCTPPATQEAEKTDTNSTTTTGSPAPAPVEETKSSVSDATGVSLVTPESWLTLDLTSPDYEKVIDERAKTMPEVSGIKELVKGYASGGQFKIIAFDVENTANGFTDNMNMIAADVPAGTTLEQVIEANEKDLGGLTAPGTQIEKSTMKVNDHDVALLKWTQKSGDKGLAMRTYFVIHGDKYYTFTFTSSAEHADAFGKAADDVMNSLRFPA